MESLAHPFADLLEFRVDHQAAGASTLSLSVGPMHMNPHQVVHGAVLYALADTGMGAALYPTLAAGETCATVEIKINYFKPVTAGKLVCRTELLHRGRSLANLESRLYASERLVAQANGHFAILRPGAGARPHGPEQPGTPS
jgi:acyl-CoA thioesterase